MPDIVQLISDYARQMEFSRRQMPDTAFGTAQRWTEQQQARNDAVVNQLGSVNPLLYLKYKGGLSTPDAMDMMYHLAKLGIVPQRGFDTAISGPDYSQPKNTPERKQARYYNPPDYWQQFPQPPKVSLGDVGERRNVLEQMRDSGHGIM